MHDILVRIPLPFGKVWPIHTYGVMAMLGFLAGLLLARWRARRVGIAPDLITDVCVWALLAGIVGSRIAYVLMYPGEFKSFAEVFKIWEGGLVFYGGFIAASAVVVLFLRARKQRLLPALDVLAPSLALGHAFGRVGCFFRGCCYGAPVAEGAWYGIVFPVDALPYDPRSLRRIAPGTPLFPTQLVEAFDLLLIFVLLSLYFKRRRADGEVTALYFVLYAVQRFVLEFFRGDTRLPGQISSAQWVSVFIFFGGLALWAYVRSRSVSQQGSGA